MILREIIVFTPIYVSLFWSIVFLANRYSDNKPRYFLGIFMATVAVLYASHACFFLGFKELYLKIDSLYLISGLSVYPLYYLYVRLLTSDTEFKKQYLIHFLPAVILGFALLLTGILSNTDESSAYYQNVLIQNRWPGTDSSPLVKTMSALFFTSRLVFGIQTFVYLLLGYHLAKKYNHRIANFYSNLEGRELVWVKLLTLTFLITSVASTVVNVLGRGWFIKHNWLLLFPSLVFSSMLFIIGLQGSKQNFTVKGLEEDEEFEEVEEVVGNFVGEKENVYRCTDKKSSTQLRHERLKKELLELLEEEKIYLNPELKITEVCRMLHTNRTYLSGLINREFRVSFNELINKHRAQQAVWLLKTDNNHLSISDIATESGFGSVSSFTRVFKNHTGITVSRFKQDQAALPLGGI